jgi:hypothetical protein
MDVMGKLRFIINFPAIFWNGDELKRIVKVQA